jgi:hypothetical protein
MEPSETVRTPKVSPQTSNGKLGANQIVFRLPLAARQPHFSIPKNIYHLKNAQHQMFAAIISC